MNKPYGAWFQRFDKRPLVYLWLLMAIYVFGNTTINALSVWTEANRGDGPADISLWEPFCWEYTSALSILLLLPILWLWFTHYPIQFSKLKKWLLTNVLASIVYCLTHVVLMVWLRECVYWIADGNYSFGDIPSEILYEYRKDAMSYMTFLTMYYIYRFIYSRLKGEASIVVEREAEIVDATSKQVHHHIPEHFLVKKLDQEFLVKVEDIDYLESSGNYVNLYVKSRIYPLRSTLSRLVKQLAPKGFAQVHRSYAVNVDKMQSLRNLPSGDAEVVMSCGAQLSLSRRYKEAFRAFVEGVNPK